MRRDDSAPRREPRQPVLRWTGANGHVEECPLFSGRPATIGRDSKNTIVLDSRLVSKAHALVEFRDGEWTIQDFASANGTKVNGAATSVRVLEPGDRIECGDVELSFLDLAARPAGPSAAAASGGSKVLRLALTAIGTLVVMLWLLFSLIGGQDESAGGPARVEETLAAASPVLVAQLKASAEASAVVRDVLRDASLAGVPEAQALLEEGRLRLETERWRDAAHLLAAAVARSPADGRAAAAFDQAAAELDRAASKALAAAELADFGMRYDDALLHADGVLQLIDRQDPRYDRALKISEHARTATRAAK